MQAANALPSKLQAKVLPASVEVKLKLAALLVVVAVGPAVMLVSGGVMSIIQAKAAGVGSVLPAASVART